MGKMLIIIGCAGSFNPYLLAEKLVPSLTAAGLEIQHASVRYKGQDHFAVGTPDDLQGALDGGGAAAVPGAPVTLAIVNENVLATLGEVRKLTGATHPAKEAKAKISAEKEKGGAGPKGTAKPGKEPVAPAGDQEGALGSDAKQPPKSETPPTQPSE